jgi:hypothetical protein
MRPVETTDPEGIDYGWVMQTTFVLTIVVGAPAVALSSLPFELATWGQRANFAVRAGAVAWLCIAVLVYVQAWRRATAETDE